MSTLAHMISLYLWKEERENIFNITINHIALHCTQGCLSGTIL